MSQPNLPPVSSLPGMVVTLQNQVAALSARDDNQDGQIQGLKDRATALETALAALTARVAMLEGRPDLSSSVTAIRTDLDALIARVASAVRLQRHLEDHAASGYDFRRAQIESPNVNAPAASNAYGPSDPGMPTPSNVSANRQSV